MNTDKTNILEALDRLKGNSVAKDSEKGENMKYKRFALGSLSTNCYVLYNESTKDAVVIDVAESGYDAMSRFIEENGLNLRAILLTHGHFDHMGGVDGFNADNLPVYVDVNDIDQCANAAVYAGMWGFEAASYTKAKPLPESRLEIGGVAVEIMRTPGHTKGSVIYIAENMMFSGDTLFCGSVGRTDLPSGSARELHESLKKLKALDGDYVVLPGHGDITTLEEEKTTNFWLR